MIYEHKNFFINCISKTGSKSSSRWCEQNGMKPMKAFYPGKPMFATMLDNRSRVLSGIAEDLHYRAIKKYNLTALEKFCDVEHLFKSKVDKWLQETDWYQTDILPISTEQCHYAPLSLYFHLLDIKLDNVRWIHATNLLDISQLINDSLGIDQHLTPLLVEQFNFETFRPGKEWYWNILSKNKGFVKWFELYVSRQYNPTYLTV